MSGDIAGAGAPAAGTRLAGSGDALAAGFSPCAACSAACSFSRILTIFLWPACLGLADVLGQNLAAAMKPAVNNLRTQCFDVGDFLVVLNHRGVGGDVHCSGVDAGQALQLLLDSEKVENRQHAADFKNSFFHAATLPAFLEKFSALSHSPMNGRASRTHSVAV